MCNSDFQPFLAHLKLLTNSKALRGISGRGLDSINTHHGSIEGIGQSEDGQQREQNGRSHGHTLITGNSDLLGFLEILDILQNDVLVANLDLLQLYN